MKTTIEFVGYPELILEQAVKAGIARSKTDGIRLGVLALNQVYNLITRNESALVLKKISEMEAKNRAEGKKPETTREVLRKYPHLRAVSP